MPAQNLQNNYPGCLSRRNWQAKCKGKRNDAIHTVDTTYSYLAIWVCANSHKHNTHVCSCQLLTQCLKIVCCCRKCCISQMIACQSWLYTNQNTSIKHACLISQPPEYVAKRAHTNVSSSPTIYSPHPAAIACRNGHQYSHKSASRASTLTIACQTIS